MYLMRLTYYSTPSITPEHGGRTTALKDILAASCKNNATSGITGTLFFNDDYFAQVIEGHRDEVSNSFVRVSADPRHEDIIILRAEPIDERLFNKWEMGFASITEQTEILYRKYSSYSRFDPSTMSAESLEQLLAEIAQSAQEQSKPEPQKVRRVASY